MDQKIETALNELQKAIEAEAHSIPSTWNQNRVRLERATATCTRLIARASAIDRISAKRTLTAILQPQTTAV